MFGTKKILAKIINGKLVIRVGGGYMNAEEFITQYGKVEMIKIKKMEEEQGGYDTITSDQNTRGSMPVCKTDCNSKNPQSSNRGSIHQNQQMNSIKEDIQARMRQHLQ